MLETALHVATTTMTFKTTFAHHAAIANANVATPVLRQTSQDTHAMIAEKTFCVTIAMNAEIAIE